MTNLRTTLLALLLSVSPLLAQDLHFEEASRGIERVVPTAMLRSSAGTLLLATPNGFYRFDDTRKDWQRISEVFGEVYGISEPIDGTIMITSASGLLRSRDEGESWVNIYRRISPVRIIAGPDGTLLGSDRFGGEFRSIWVSKDGGRNWDVIRIPFSVPAATSIVSLGDRYYMASHSGVKVTYNEGGVWETTRLTDPIVELIRTESGALVAATGEGERVTTLWESIDSGTSWQQVDSIPGARMLAAAQGDRYWVGAGGLTATGDQDLFGLYRRQIGSTERTEVMASGGLQSISAAEGRLFIADGHELREIAEDDGLPRDIRGTLHDVPVERIAVAPNNDIYLLVPSTPIYGRNDVVNRHALYRSEDAGISWQFVSDDLAGPHLHVDPLRAAIEAPLVIDRFGTIYSARMKWSWVDSADVQTSVLTLETIISRDRGETWQTVFPGVLKELHDRPDGSIALVGLDSVGLGPWHDIPFSVDSGRTWKRVGEVDPDGWSDIDGSIYPSGIAFAEDGTLLAGFDSPFFNDTGSIARIVLKEEGPLTITSVDTTPTHSLVRRPDGSIVAATERGILRSENNGASFALVNPRNNITRLQIYPQDVIWGHPSYFSRDGGENWDIHRLATEHGTMVPANDTLLYLLNLEAFYSTDNRARTFRRPDLSRQPQRMLSIAVDSTGRVFLGSGLDAVHRSINPSSVLEPGAERDLEGINLSMRDRILSLDVSRPGFEVHLFSMEGRRVSLEGDGVVGQTSATYDLSGLPSGAYVVVIRRDDRVDGIRILLP